MDVKDFLLLTRSERSFQRELINAAHILGWRVVHFRPALTQKGWRTPVQGDGVGFPDLILVRGGRLIFAELKSENGKANDAQKAWAKILGQTPAEVYLWRPSDWSTIVEVLK